MISRAYRYLFCINSPYRFRFCLRCIPVPLYKFSTIRRLFEIFRSSVFSRFLSNFKARKKSISDDLRGSYYYSMAKVPGIHADDDNVYQYRFIVITFLLLFFFSPSFEFRLNVNIQRPITFIINF